jgi:hypothetical protein
MQLIGFIEKCQVAHQLQLAAKKNEGEWGSNMSQYRLVNMNPAYILIIYIYISDMALVIVIATQLS